MSGLMFILGVLVGAMITLVWEGRELNKLREESDRIDRNLRKIYADLGGYAYEYEEPDEE